MNNMNPSKTDSLSAAKQKGRKRSSIRTKITLWAGFCLVLVSLILIGYSVISLRQTTINNATDEVMAVAEAKAGIVQNEVALPLFAARTLAQSLSAIKDPAIPVSMSREDVNAMLRETLIKNQSFYGTYTLWEPNEFDGNDAQYVRATAHDKTGRFIPYWVRGDDGIIHTEALTHYQSAGDGDWYMQPRRTLQEMTVAPVVRRIEGQEVSIASFVIPIVRDDKFYGIAGVDAPIGFVQQLMDNIDLYDSTTNAVLFTDTGRLIAVRQRPELASLSADLIYKDFDSIQNRFDKTFTRLSPDGKYLQVFSPIPVNGSGERWVMGLIIPFDKITAPATATAIRQTAISTSLIVLALVLLSLLAAQIVRPMETLTNAALAVSQGDWSVTADVHSNDEAEVLASAFNSMTTQLRSAFNTLEQRVADRTKALAASSEVSRRLSNILDQKQLVSEVVNQVNTAFGYYHTQIYFFDEAKENLVMAGGTGEAGKMMLEQFHKVHKGNGLVGRAAALNEVVFVPDTSQNSEWLPNRLLPDTKAEIAIPIAIGDDVLGVLDIQHHIPNGLNQEDTDALVAIANQVAVAIQNAWSYAEIQRSQAQLSEALNVSRLANWEYDVEQDLFTFNDHFYSLFRTTAEQAGGYRLSSAEYAQKFVHPEDAPLVGGEIQKVLASNERHIAAAVEHRFLFENNKIGYMSVRINVERDENGKIIRWYGANQDVSERRLLEEINRKNAFQQEAINTITQKIQSATSVETALQVAVRELGHTLGNPIKVQLAPSENRSNN